MTSLKPFSATHFIQTSCLIVFSCMLFINHAKADESKGENMVSPDKMVSLDFTEWKVEWQNSRPRDPYISPDGQVWFVGQVGDYIARLDPQSGDMQRYDIPQAGPHTVIVDDKGYPWYAGNKDKHIGRLDPETGKVTRFEMPEGVNDPHTMAWTSDGNIWFTVQRSGKAGFIGKLATDTGEVDRKSVV